MKGSKKHTIASENNKPTERIKKRPKSSKREKKSFTSTTEPYRTEIPSRHRKKKSGSPYSPSFELSPPETELSPTLSPFQSLEREWRKIERLQRKLTNEKSQLKNAKKSYEKKVENLELKRSHFEREKSILRKDLEKHIKKLEKQNKKRDLQLSIQLQKIKEENIRTLHVLDRYKKLNDELKRENETLRKAIIENTKSPLNLSRDEQLQIFDLRQGLNSEMEKNNRFKESFLELEIKCAALREELRGLGDVEDRLGQDLKNDIVRDIGALFERENRYERLFNQVARVNQTLKQQLEAENQKNKELMQKLGLA